ncbi:Nn.00g108810.m01.CDS01 [Neocucurbitaria sp. VM-36]
MYTIPSGKFYTEPYRITCPPAINGSDGYCWDYDKLRGQGVSIKVSNNQSVAEDVLQFELYYDVSLLDCGKVANYAANYGFDLTDPNHRTITDASSTDDDHKAKVEKCPGYKGGLTVTFPSDTIGEKWGDKEY